MGRNLSKIQPVIDRLNKINSSIKIDFVKIDLSDNSSVRAAAKGISSTVDSIDILINSAGIMALDDYQLSKDGFELQLAACHIGHFLLTGLLIPQLAASKSGARVVSLTSTGYEVSDFRWDDWNFQGGKTYNPWLGYAQAKSANLHFINELSRRGSPKNIKAFVVHPGVVLESGIMQSTNMEALGKALEATKAEYAARGEEYVPEQLKTMEQGCSTTVVAAIQPDLQSGTFLMDCQPARKEKVKSWVYDEEKAGKLWTLSEDWVGQQFL